MDPVVFNVRYFFHVLAVASMGSNCIDGHIRSFSHPLLHSHSNVYILYSRVVVYEQCIIYTKYTRMVFKQLYMFFVFLYRCSNTVISFLLYAHTPLCQHLYFACARNTDNNIARTAGSSDMRDIFKVLHHNLFSSCLSSLSTSLLSFFLFH